MNLGQLQSSILRDSCVLMQKSLLRVERDKKRDVQIVQTQPPCACVSKEGLRGFIQSVLRRCLCGARQSRSQQVFVCPEDTSAELSGHEVDIEYGLIKSLLPGFITFLIFLRILTQASSFQSCLNGTTFQREPRRYITALLT